MPALSVDHPTVTITPSTHLRDGQVVEVRVTGFGVGGKVWLSECASAAAATGFGCGIELAAQPFLVTDDLRSGGGSFAVRSMAAVRPLIAAPTEPCTDQCVLVATIGPDFAFVVAPIEFDTP